MQRGRWCMIQGFREPHMTGDCKMAKSVALSIVIVAVGAAVLKYGVGTRLGGDPVLDPMNYVRGTFGWGGVVGGFIFGLGAMLAGGCGSGALWRVGEGQIKLWVAVIFFSLSNSLVVAWFSAYRFRGERVSRQLCLLTRRNGIRLHHGSYCRFLYPLVPGGYLERGYQQALAANVILF